MTISSIAETVDVVASPAIAETTGTLGSSETVSNRQTQWIAPGGGVQSSLRLLSTVIGTPSGESINAGRPHQAGFQISAATMVDPANNLARAWLPSDGVDTVTVLPNPSETDTGASHRASSRVQPRRASDRWRFAVNNTIPAFRTKRYTIANIEGLGQVKPSLETGGPLVKGKVFLEQTAQFNWFTTDVPSRPEDELKTSQWFASMTRLDANMTPHNTLGDHHRPRQRRREPRDARHVHAAHRDGQRRGQPAATPSSPSALSSATRRSSRRPCRCTSTTTRVSGQNTLPMVLLPETTFGDFYNRQHRQSSTVQWVEAVSTSRNGFGGQHLIKIGTDLMANTYDRPEHERAGHHRAIRPRTLAQNAHLCARRPRRKCIAWTSPRSRRTGFSRRSAGHIEFAARVDRDGVAEDVSASPRTGAAVLLNTSGSAVLRAGYGLFYERTPSVAGAFRSFETATDSALRRRRRHPRRSADGDRPRGRRPAVGARRDVGRRLRSSPELALGDPTRRSSTATATAS